MSISFDAKIEQVKLNGVAIKAYVREMTWKERKAYEESSGLASGEERDPGVSAELLILATACDEQGERLFSEEERDAVSELPTGVFMAIFKASSLINSISDANVERERKNS
jgi:hypothetical protein